MKTGSQQEGRNQPPSQHGQRYNSIQCFTRAWGGGVCFAENHNNHTHKMNKHKKYTISFKTKLTYLSDARVSGRKRWRYCPVQTDHYEQSATIRWRSLVVHSLELALVRNTQTLSQAATCNSVHFSFTDHCQFHPNLGREPPALSSLECEFRHQTLRKQGGTGKDDHIPLTQWTFGVAASEKKTKRLRKPRSIIQNKLRPNAPLKRYATESLQQKSTVC